MQVRWDRLNAGAVADNWLLSTRSVVDLVREECQRQLILVHFVIVGVTLTT